MKKWLRDISETVAVTLVALVVLAFVAGLFLPAQGGSNERSRRMNCKSNLKMIGICFSMYAEQYQGRFPMDADNPTLVGSIGLMSNVLTSSKCWYCPSDRRTGTRPASSYEAPAITNISYSYVPNLIWYDPKSTNPPAIVMLDRIGSSTAAGSKWPRNGNHKTAGGHVLFTDGHVEWVTNLPSALKDKDGKEVVLSP